MPHEVGGADGGRAAAAVLAVDEAGAAGAHRGLYGGTGGFQVRQQVLGWVVEHGHAQLGHAGCSRAGLLTRDVDAQGDACPRQQLRRGRGACVPEEERGGDVRERWRYRRGSLSCPGASGSPRVHDPRLALGSILGRRAVSRAPPGPKGLRGLPLAGRVRPIVAPPLIGYG